MDNAVQNAFAQVEDGLGLKRTKIKGTDYTINVLPALPAYILGVELMETLLPSIGSASDNGLNIEEILPEDRAVFTQVAVYLVKSLKDLDKVTIIQQLLEGATMNGQPLDLILGMRGKVSDLAFLIEFALKENFTDFFIEYIKDRVTDLPSLIQGIMPQTTPLEE
jgi:hypothetical protein